VKLVADENVDLSIVAALRASGHEVWYVAEESRGIGDEEVLRKAWEETALLLTADKDFGELVFRQGKASAGVLLLRLAGTSSVQREKLVSEAVNQYGEELAGAFSVLTPRALRIRDAKGPG